MFMDYNNVNKIGKIKELNKEFGIGKIVSTDDIYLFTINDIKENLNIGDLVRFRGEEVNEEKRAFFITKVNNDYILNNNNIIKSKIFNKE